jgi:hypothetical protein
MNILVISDYFYNLINQKDIHYVKWTETDFPSALIGYQAILVDVTIKKNELQDRAPLLYKLKTELEDENLLKRNNLILVIVCGSPNKALKFDTRDDEDYDEIDEKFNQDMEESYKQDFSTYMFLEKIVPSYSSRLIFKKSTHTYPIALIPVNYYLDSSEGRSNYLYYDYLPGSEKCNDVTPLSKMSPDRDACISFECRKGRGMSIILPSYDIAERESAFSLLLRICRSYIKKVGGMRQINKKVYSKLPQPVKDAYIEALTCFNLDLYFASLMMCRRTLEASIIEEQRKSNKIIFLGKRIIQLYEDGIISSELKDVAMYIKDFGDWGAHPGKYKGKKVTGSDVMMIINFLEIYLIYFHDFREQKQRVENRKGVLANGED